MCVCVCVTVSAHLDHGVMNIDGGHGQLVLLRQLVQPMYPCHALLHHPPHVLGCPGELGQETVSGISSIVQDHCRLPTCCLGEGGEVKG